MLAEATVRALREAGHSLFVVAASPPGFTCDTDGKPKEAQPEFFLPVSSWFRLDISSPWQEFAAGCADATLSEKVLAFQPQVVYGVDWSALPPYEALFPAHLERPPFVWSALRIFSFSDAAHKPLERAAAAAAAAVVALSPTDADYIRRRLQLRPEEGAPSVPIVQVRCPLRAAVTVAAAKAPVGQLAPPRDLLLCCVRLAPEKEPHRFVALVEALSASGALRSAGVKPAMCVGQSRSEYGDDLIRRLKSAAPDALIIDSFLDADALADLFQRTALNVHPPLYDTFGMSVVEAAAFGAPSLLHSGGMVGATVAVRPAHGEALEADLSSLSVGGPATEVEAAREVPATARLSPDGDAAATAAAAAEEGVKELVGQMAALLLDLGHLAAVGAAAKARALAYGEADHGAEVAEVLRAVVSARETPPRRL